MINNRVPPIFPAVPVPRLKRESAQVVWTASSANEKRVYSDWSSTTHASPTTSLWLIPFCLLFFTMENFGIKVCVRNAVDFIWYLTGRVQAPSTLLPMCLIRDAI